MAQRIQHFAPRLNDKNPPMNKESKGNRLLANKDGFTKSNDPMDDAMQELLEMCKQFNDELSVDGEDLSVDQKSESESIGKEIKDNRIHRLGCDPNQPNNISKMINKEDDKSLNKVSIHYSIQSLQQKQTQLQAMLDNALIAAKELESRSQKRKCLLEEQIENQDETTDTFNEILDGDEEYDDELLEFQKIESELKISDLNRQLNIVQEELRMKLYKRLLFNTNVKNKAPTTNIPEIKQNSRHFPQNLSLDDNTPPSSLCSEDTGGSSVSTSNSYSISRKSPPIVDQTNESSSQKGAHSRVETMHAGQDDEHIPTTDSTISNQNDNCNISTPMQQTSIKKKDEKLIKRQLTNDSSEKACYPDRDTPITPTASRDSGLSSTGRRSTSTDESSNIYSTPETSCSSQEHIKSTLTNTNTMYTSSPTCFGYYRNNSANSDLERIEEDEEDIQGPESSSPNHFRTIYEEKLAPIIHNSTTITSAIQNNDYPPAPPKRPELRYISGNISELGCEAEVSCKEYSSRIEEVSIKNNKEESFVTSTGGATPRPQHQLLDFHGQATWTNRPLTLYLPKPNEKIDLVEHIQALGHDLNVIAGDIKIDSTSASGYLRKQSSKNSRRWLKKYFHFDRASKKLSYYDNETQLTKKKPLPKISIPFANIYDVYVDHIRSGIGKKDFKSTKNHQYIFVLSTAERKYSLASYKTETMRAWIDILFTAAQVNEYLE